MAEIIGRSRSIYNIRLTIFTLCISKFLMKCSINSLINRVQAYYTPGHGFSFRLIILLKTQIYGQSSHLEGV